MIYPVICPTPLTGRGIMEMTAHAAGITVAQMVGPDRCRAVSLPRQVAMHLVRKHTELSFPQIGRLFGGFDHSTVMYADKKVAGLIAALREQQAKEGV